MRTFSCTCGNTIYFDNCKCVQCERVLGFDTTQNAVRAFEPVANDQWQASDAPQKIFRKCENYKTANICNWMVPAEDNDAFCLACRLNTVIPDLSKPENPRRWYRLESAKRRLIYTLIALRLPIISYKQDPVYGLAFRFMEDVTTLDPYSEEIVTYEQIMTGHDTGTITINILEADDSAREAMREMMNESYRTILGHFRHEIGHYYWDRLIARTQHLAAFRELFGDERSDYQISIATYYERGAAFNWHENYISAYASAHPWEDWAESWAHYMHYMDLLETASHHHIGIQKESLGHTEQSLRDWLSHREFSEIVMQLNTLTRSLNELNRSLGLPDPYPFEHSPTVIKKLEFVHQTVMMS